jgi:hypothetical protein
LDAEDKGLNIVEGLAPSKVEKEAAQKVRAGDVGALATPGVMAPTVGGEREGGKERENVWMMMKTGTN